MAKTGGTNGVKSGKIRVGIGGWTYEPWRGEFYPKGLPHARELTYASQRLTSIEVNGTFYRTQAPATFAKWAKETPEGFVFSVKGVRYATNRKVLAEAGESVDRFLKSGVLELGDKLGPILWQFTPTKKFDPDDFGAFLALLPKSLQGHTLRHVVEVRHASFCVPEFVALLRKHAVPVVFAEHAAYPAIPDPVGDFVYLRLQKGQDSIATCYPPKELDAWAKRAEAWAKGGAPKDLQQVGDGKGAKAARDVFVYFIHEGKVRAPAGAMEMIKRVDG